MKRILVVDDEEQIRALVHRGLARLGYEVECVSDANAARAALLSFGPDLIILDILLPGMSGIEFCQELRKTRNTPIIFLSGLDTDVDRIVGLEIGADDYLTKPFNPGELVARVKAVLRRAGTPTVEIPDDSDGMVIAHGALRVDLEQHIAFFADEELDLTKTEFDLLRVLMRRPTKVYSREDLRIAVWGPTVYVADRTINSHMRRLREKCGVDPIETVRAVGYRMAREPRRDSSEPQHI